MQLKYFLKPFPLKSLVDDIEEKEKNVKECAEMATMQRVMGMHSMIHSCFISKEATNANVTEDIETSIQNIRSQMAPLITLDGMYTYNWLYLSQNHNIRVSTPSLNFIS